MTFTVYTYTLNHTLEFKSFTTKSKAVEYGNGNPRSFYYIEVSDGLRIRGTVLMIKYQHLPKYQMFQQYPGMSIDQVREKTTYQKPL